VSDANPGPAETDLGGAPSVLIALLAGAFRADRAWQPPPSSSLREEKRVPSLLLSTAARDPGKDLGMGY
jgi:hypothetical protein